MSSDIHSIWVTVETQRVTRLLRKDLNTAFHEQRIAGLWPAHPERRNRHLAPAPPPAPAIISVGPHTNVLTYNKTVPQRPHTPSNANPAFGRNSPSNASQAYGLNTPSDAIPAFGRYSPSNASQAYGLHTPTDAIPAFGRNSVVAAPPPPPPPAPPAPPPPAPPPHYKFGRTSSLPYNFPIGQKLA